MTLRLICSVFIVQSLFGLNAQDKHKYTNELIHEKSEYLLQHAHNPVDWMPWGEKAFKKAEKENKLMIISIGYSSCHWCHVMEKESFENEKIAQYMNEHFVCVKVDREERMDVDNMYITAIALINKNTGWPLNCFALADGRPFFGGTYYAPNDWLKLLQSIQQTQTENPNQIIEFAEKLKDGISEGQFIPIDSTTVNFNADDVIQSVNGFKNKLDFENGGLSSEGNKFPMSSNLDLLMTYSFWNGDSSIMNYVSHSLDRMMMGGIYDQIGGGFARYSIDKNWKVPHFEKMLYSNAQLISNYSKAYKLTHKESYKRVVEQTIVWLEREMADDKGRFYASQDADSEEKEGLYYTWTKLELKEVLGDDFEWVKEYFEINPLGVFEGDRYVLIRSELDESFAKSKEWTNDYLYGNLDRILSELYAKRQIRVKPFTDEKMITSWNAQMVSGLTDAYEAFGENRYLEMAEKCMSALLEQIGKSDLIHHLLEGSDDAFLDDYAFSIRALIDLYQVTFKEKYLLRAYDLTNEALLKYKDQNSPYFFYSMKNRRVTFRAIELQDLASPSSNAVMAENLFLIGKYFENDEFVKLSEIMSYNMKASFQDYGASFSYWGNVMQYFSNPFYEVVIAGEKSRGLHLEWLQEFIPNSIIIGGKSSLPLLREKMNVEVPTIFVCKEKVCQKPVFTINEALELMPR